MAAKKSIAKGTGPHSRPPRAQTAGRSRRVLKSRASAKTRKSRRPVEPRPVRGAQKRTELVEMLSARLSLVETAALALQKFEDISAIGGICTSLEQAVRMLAKAHEEVEQYLLGSSR
jgi:hypothetical protein